MLMALSGLCSRIVRAREGAGRVRWTLLVVPGDLLLHHRGAG